MKICKLPELTETVLPAHGVSVALGNFDGVHIGHRRLLSVACDSAKTIPDCVPAVWTFTSLVKLGTEVPALTTPMEKYRQFAEAGIPYVILEEFSRVRQMSAENFVREYLVRGLRCAAVVCGFNFRFGYRGSGDVELLERILREEGIPLTVIPPVMCRNRIVSSTRIRAFLAEGDMEGAREMLGRPFSICFPVIYGNQLGRTIGVPTINQNFPTGHIIPRHGIYACICTVSGRRYMGVSNVGVRPSVASDGHVNCETHIINYDGFLYGHEIKVEFCHRLRDERKFASIDELKNAIAGDIRNTRAYFSATGWLDRDGEVTS